MGQAEPAAQGMMVWIRVAAKQIREEHACSPARVAAERDVTEWTVRRFEQGRTVKVNVDLMIAAYSRCTGVPTVEFWRRALELWQAET
jgi:hypothetical protein